VILLCLNRLYTIEILVARMTGQVVEVTSIIEGHANFLWGVGRGAGGVGST
jgi:hypothetical protein